MTTAHASYGCCHLGTISLNSFQLLLICQDPLCYNWLCSCYQDCNGLIKNKTYGVKKMIEYHCSLNNYLCRLGVGWYSLIPLYPTICFHDRSTHFAPLPLLIVFFDTNVWSFFFFFGRSDSRGSMSQRSPDKFGVHQLAEGDSQLWHRLPLVLVSAVMTDSV
jgi:hypothetical protein